ncbi:MAG: hypothetical protein R3E84_20440 [Pseudomonadales bacterium]
MFADQRQALPLLLAPLRGLAVEEVGVDATVELVDVHGVDAVLQPVVLGLNAPYSILVMLLLVTVADTQGLGHPGEHLVVEAQTVQQLREPFLQDLLPGVRLGAFPLGAAAVVVDVAALLDLGDHGAAAMPATDQAGERKVAFRLFVAVDVAAAELRDCALSHSSRLTIARAFRCSAYLSNRNYVDRVSRHLVNAALRHGVAAVAKRQPVLTGLVE